MTPEDAHAAAELFLTLCEDQLLAHASHIKTDIEEPGYPSCSLTRARQFPDASRVRARIITREQKLPDNHPAKYLGLQDALCGIYMNSQIGEGPTLEVRNADFMYDEVTDTIQKRVRCASDIAKHFWHLMEQAEASAVPGETATAVEAAIDQEIDIIFESRRLERALGIGSVVVGTAEVTELKILVESLNLAA
ncbi:MAG TPA: hypothetical protein VJR27_05425 [Candidatus Saccharimonadales bacterium]|nr:hypothetical protein [Candidatus Saccharimonadales bacterium]